MMQQVLLAELEDRQRVFALVLGPVNTRHIESADPDWVTADQVGAIAVAASAGATAGQEIRMRNQAEVKEALTLLQITSPNRSAESGPRPQQAGSPRQAMNTVNIRRWMSLFGMRSSMPTPTR